MKAFLEVHLKLVMTIWIILVSVLGLLYLMNYMKFTSLMSTVVSSQLQVMSTSLERSIIRAEQLGLPLSEMDNLPELMQRAKGRDEQVSALYVIDPQGKVLFATDSKSLPREHSAQILRRALKGDEPFWSLEETDTLYSGLQLFDGTEQLMGGIVIAYDKSSYGSVLAQVKLHLLEMTVMIFGGFAVLIFIAVRFGFGDVNDVFKLISSQLPKEKNHPSPPQPQLKPGSMAFRFAEQIDQSNRIKKQLNQELDAMTSEVKHPSPAADQQAELDKKSTIHD
ncbi:PDC sensor domain-containing protein [Marinobacterium arenosum]|uniref:PDC sensor domain-containing protein n=1 Tax=Marinobacterium arenosum TaxID=2862496 RepID=UPI001C95B3BB|nr:PDC sensor domain-containing protein [Marinobacterium arenosum]MBY4677091.1 PDC sensor domain-containing protein [Marinobacterium arenosum]